MRDGKNYEHYWMNDEYDSNKWNIDEINIYAYEGLDELLESIKVKRYINTDFTAYGTYKIR